MEKVVLPEERNKDLFSAPQKNHEEPKMKTRVVLHGRTRY